MKKIVSLAVLTFVVINAIAQKPIRYEISFPNYQHHEAEVSVLVDELKPGPVQFRVSRSSPGRYATHEFGKNVYNVKAADVNGKSLDLKRLEGDLYEVQGQSGLVKLTYTLYGVYADGTYSDIDETQAHLNIPASFMWVKGKDTNPIEVEFKTPKDLNWKIATQLKPTEKAGTYSAPNLQYFMDSPTELSNHFQRSFEVKNPDGKIQTIKLALHAAANNEDVDKYNEMVKKVVLEEQAVFGELPEYDFGNYTFIQNVNVFVHGDGMEHRNSTIITDQGAFKGNEKDFLSTVSHEFFHQWNVERIRPKTLEPFNFEHANMSNELWFAEGFTNYYGILLLKRAGFYSINDYCNKLSSVSNTILNSAGAKTYSPVTMSNQAVFVDAGVSIDKANYPNNFASYYPYGEITALALDLRLRTEFKNLDLDKYMQAVWKTHGKTEISYTNADLQKVLAEVTGNKTFADDFFNRYVYNSEKNDYEKLLGKAGLLLRKARSGQAWVGIFSTIVVKDEGLMISSPTQKGNPIYEAGLDFEDVIKTIDGEAVNDQAGLQAILMKHQLGDKITVVFNHRGINKTSTVTLAENPRLEVVPYEAVGMTLTDGMKGLRSEWLESKVNGDR